MNYPKHVTLVEVGARDGLQNEPVFVATEDKIQLINQLSLSGLQRIEATSFVSGKAIPQLADHDALLAGIQKNKHVRYSALVPNILGMEQAIVAGVTDIAVFTAASESFNQRNIHCSIKDSLIRFEPVIQRAKNHGIAVRAYISCVAGCPYEGDISPQRVASLTNDLLALGADEIALGDTIGVGTPRQIRALLDCILKILPLTQTAMHFHDTYGQAIANIEAALQYGVAIFDSAIAGLGGCPYAQGATGNVATEDVLYLLHGLGIETGIDLFQIVKTGDWICKTMSRRNHSKVGRALLATA